MTLETCIQIGKDCGLHTIGECYINIEIHSLSLFPYNEINKKILELQKDFFYHNPDEFCKIFDSTKEDLIAKGWKIKV